MSPPTSKSAGTRIVKRHSLVVRICHWVNAICFVFLLMSGLQIFNAHPALNWGDATDFEKPILALVARGDDDRVLAGETLIAGHAFDTTGLLGASRDATGQLEARGFPAWATLPAVQDLATGRRWHFFFAWALVINGALYMTSFLIRRRSRDFVPSLGELRAIPRAIWDHVRLRFPKGEEALHYNVLQKLAYLSVLVALPILILAGLTMSPGIDAAAPWLVDLFGGRQSARSVHFLLATYLVVFLVVHLVMVVVSGFANNIASMITGRYRIEEESHAAQPET
jgi:thiosulfate reductase cytochrome b subunit